VIQYLNAARQSLDFSMKHKQLSIGVGTFFVLGSMVLVFRVMTVGDLSGVDSSAVGDSSPMRHERRSSSSLRGDLGDLNRKVDGEDSQATTRSLELPELPLDEKNLGKFAENSTLGTLSTRKLLTDDEILVMGGVLPVPGKTSSMTGVQTGKTRSIKAEEWNGAPNLLVNALRSGDRFEINHNELMDFLRGKDLLGWPEGYRNWIGDELMTALRQDMPQTAFEDLKSIVDNPAAPAAMRDYSVQHISHLMTSGVIGKEGADYIWETLGKNDAQTLSTALISLHRLSEQVPGLVSAKEVMVAAERLKENPDGRTRLTAESILKK
jgi:hypothetical protein